jgi:hypothetical protein
MRLDIAVSFAELFKTFCEEAPGPPELGEIFAACGVDAVDLAWWALIGGHLLHVHEAALFDADEQRVDSPFGDVRESPLSQPGSDLISVGGALRERSQDEALKGSLEHLGQLPTHRTSATQ